jgi:hypothetical protein
MASNTITIRRKQMRKRKSIAYKPTGRESVVIGTLIVLPYAAIAIAAVWGLNKLINKLPETK